MLLAVLGGGGYWAWNRTVVAPPDLSRADSTDPRILVLAYDRVNNRGTETAVTPRALREQLEALRQEGFDPVTLQELTRFYYEGRPLPPKPILLTFDFGYLDTYDAVDPVLRAMGWRAVMFLVTSRQARRDAAYLYWDRVRRMVNSGVWEIGAQGHLSYDPIPLDERGAVGSFLLDRMWLGVAGRHESLAEFTDRVRGDYAVSKQAIESNVRGDRMLACASRIGIAGTTTRDAFQANRDAMSSLCPLGFVEDRLGVNDRLSDPRGLKRLRVNPDWSVGDIIQRLRAALDDPPFGSSDKHRAPPAWVADVGEVSVEHGDLVMIGSPRVDLWLPGSQWPLDWVIEADLWSNGADVWLVQESDTPGKSWRWGGNDRAIVLQRSQWGRPPETVATFPRGITSGVWHHVKLVKRGAGVWVEWDGRPLRKRPVYLSGMGRGVVGVVGWRSEGGATVRMRHLTFSRYPFEMRSVSANPSEHEVTALIRDAPTIAALSPLGGVMSGDRVQDVRFDRELLAILSHRYGWEVVPMIRVLPGREAAAFGASEGAPSRPSVQWSATLLDYIERNGWSGIGLDLRHLPPSARPELGDGIDQLDRRLRAQGRRFVQTTGGDKRLHASPAYASR
ncbi:MAG TPA: polysaccharide deacetylase family protein [Nitrospiria bacterium]|nr:polysaccharide deacetylase family protein [Nitrospiria bacterium]